MSKEKDTFKRDYPDRPIAAVGVVVVRGRQVLLVQRSKPPKSQTWSIPGGAQHLGETVKAAASREVFEETAIRIKNITLLDIVDFIERDEQGGVKYHYSLMDYRADYDHGEICAGDDARDAKWVDFDALDRYNLWPETHRIIEKAMTNSGNG